MLRAEERWLHLKSGSIKWIEGFGKWFPWAATASQIFLTLQLVEAQRAMLSIMNASSGFFRPEGFYSEIVVFNTLISHWDLCGKLFGFGVLVEAVTACDGEITWTWDLDWVSCRLTSQRCLPWNVCQGNGGDEMARESLCFGDER